MGNNIVIYTLLLILFAVVSIEVGQDEFKQEDFKSDYQEHPVMMQDIEQLQKRITELEHEYQLIKK